MADRLSEPCHLTWNSIRLFFALPSLVLFGAMGSLGPIPIAVMRDESMPFRTSHDLTDSARCWERRSFPLTLPVLSV